MENKPWYDVLLAARRLEKKSPEGWTSKELAKEAGIEPTSASSETAIASAWCGKFYRWGYVLPIGASIVGAGRPSNVYKLTAWGNEFRVKAGAKKGEKLELRMVPKEQQRRMRMVANPPKDNDE